MVFSFNVLTKEYMQHHVDDFISMNNTNLKNEYWQADHFLAELNKKWALSFYATTTENKMAGFLIASDKIATIHIHKYVVDEPFQQQGLGSNMLKHLMDLTEKNISLKVEIANENAIQFYLKKGFLITDSQGNLHNMIYKR
jgi:ribosomal protein S18 acetylase RimI-like enzyme